MFMPFGNTDILRTCDLLKGYLPGKVESAQMTSTESALKELLTNTITTTYKNIGIS